jgi:glycerophosphoryl diester phosphodiesterase
MIGACVVMSFEPETWRRVRALRPDVAAGALYSGNALRAAGQTAGQVIQEASRSGVRFVGLHQSLVDEAAVSAARNAGVLLGVWTVNEQSAVRRFIDLGVGVVITDRPDVAKALLGR